MRRPWSFLSVLMMMWIGCGGSGTTPITTTPTMPAGFAGTWAGQVADTTVSCSDGETIQSQTMSYSITLAENGSNVSWMPSANQGCANIVLQVNGNAATQVQDVTCAPQTINGTLAVATLSGAAMALDGNGLQLSYTLRLTASNGNGTVTCNLPFMGTLLRQ